MNQQQLHPRMRHKFKLRNNKLEESSLDLNDEIELMSNNLLKVQRELTEQDDHSMNYGGGQVDGNSDQQITMNKNSKAQPIELVYKQNQEKNSRNDEDHGEEIIPSNNFQILLKQKYQDYLNQNKFSSNYQQKINQLLDSQQNTMSIGNSIALFEMVFYFKEILTAEVLSEIQSKAFESFVYLDSVDGETQIQKKQEINNQKSTISEHQLFKICLVELIAICGIPSEQITQFFVQYMLQHPSEFTLSYKLLINMGSIGISTLINILNQDFQQFTSQLLTHLSKTESIIQNIIIPHIINDLTHSTISSKERNISLKVLKRLGEIAYSQKLVEVLVGLFRSSTIDKNLLISTIRATCKQQGERILISLLHQENLNQQIAIFIIKCLSHQPLTSKQPLPQIIVSDYPGANLFQMSKLYCYQPFINNINNAHFQTQSTSQQINDILYINPRIFCSLLQKFLVHNVESNNNRFGQQQEEFKKLQCHEIFVLPKIIEKDGEEQLPNLQVVSLFMGLVGDNNKSCKNNNRIREAAIQALGNIPLPYNPTQIIQKLTLCLSSSTDPSILSTTCLTLSKLNSKPHQKLTHKLTELLKNNYWKVRIAACQTLGILLREPNQLVIQTLIKCLKDGSINRQLVCQTMIRIHPVCEQILIKILKESQDYKIQQIILCSFNQPKLLLSQNLPQILQTIFDFSHSKQKQLRYICIGVVNSLRKYAQQKSMDVTYFKSKNILPFYYNFLDDLSLEIRDLALGLILQFGSFAELVLIEGMTKGKTNCRVQCAKGLGQRGVQNFRALLLGVRDMSEKVRKQCCSSIIKNFQLHQIVEEYKDKSSQCISLIYNIKDLLMSNLLNQSQEIQLYLRELIVRLGENNEQLAQQQQEDQEDGYYQENEYESEEIEKEIQQFRQSMKMRKQKEYEVGENGVDDGGNDQNIDPNIVKVPTEQKKVSLNQQYKFSKLHTQQVLQQHKQKQKRYYFQLNETIS